MCRHQFAIVCRRILTLCFGIHHSLKISSTVIRFEAWSTPLEVRSFKAAERRFSVKIKGFDAVSLSIEEMRMRGGGIGAGSGKIFALRQQCPFYKF